METKRILIIDDEPAIRTIVEIALQTITGWEVLTAASGLEGIIIAETERPDGILLDMMMPEMDGIRTFHEMQANAITRSIPVIIVTAKPQMTGELSPLTSLPIAGIISKPFRASELVEKIRNFLGWHDEK